MTEKKEGVSGTKEWSVASVNAIRGCEHLCRYCYAREMALRFKRIDWPDDWRITKVARKPSQERRKYKGTVMYPSTHDITPAHLDVSVDVLKNLLGAGNDVLIVSKPHVECIERLLVELREWKDNILFRFTIGCMDADIAETWEPYAPSPVERMKCLVMAYGVGYRTSVSMEPMLDPENIVQDFRHFRPYVTDSIWIGKMNHIRKRVHGVSMSEIDRIEKGQTDSEIWRIYHALKDEPKVRWKESIKKIVGLPLATESGTDQ